MKGAWGADKLEAQLDAARNNLRGLEKDIRKILGRDVAEGENGLVPATARLNQKRPVQEDRRRPANEFPNNGVGAKRRYQQNSNNAEPKTVFSRLSARVPSTADDSGDEDDGSKPAVSSRVIVTPRDVPSRQEVIRRESTDERSKQRNRRMFGALLGTLQKFRQEETKLKAKEDKKAEIEARVEEAKRKEKEELKKERQQLFLHRKQQAAQVKALEAKVARSKAYEEWRNSQIPLMNFIKTKTEPHIFYLPRVSTPETDALLQKTAKEIKEEIEVREKELLYDLEIIQTRPKRERNPHTSTEDAEKQNLDPNIDADGDVVMAEIKEDDKDDFREEDRYEHIEEDADEEKELFEIQNDQKYGESKNDTNEKQNIERTSKNESEEREGENVGPIVGMENYSDYTTEVRNVKSEQHAQDNTDTKVDNNDSSQNELIGELRKIYEEENGEEDHEVIIKKTTANRGMFARMEGDTEDNNDDITKLELIYQNIANQLIHPTQEENCEEFARINQD